MSTPESGYVGFGSDTDCDGTSYYACGVLARDADHAREVLREDFGGMTNDGIHEVKPYDQAVKEEPQVAGILERTFDYPEGERPFRYVSLGADWNPWVYDDSIGIPALDSRYDEAEVC